MSEKVIEHQNTLSVVALAAVVIVLYSLLASQREAAFSSNSPQTQLARN